MRMPKPWYRKARSMWYANLDGKQVPLGVSGPAAESAAWDALKALVKQAAAGVAPPAPPPPAAGPPPDPRTVREAVAGFLAHRDGRVKPDTLSGYARILRPFLAQFGECRVEGLDADAVERHAAARRWSDTTRANYLNTVELCLRWAGARVRFRKPPRASAGADSVIPRDVYEKLLVACVGDWRQVIRFLWLTGCRPSEASGVTTEAVDWGNAVVRLRHHKTAAKGKQRLIYLCPEAKAVLAEQRAKHGGGPLFRGKNGRPFSRQAFVMKFARLSKRVGRRVTAYQLRHSFATRALEAGERDATVAALLGHSGTQMLYRHYAHLTEQAKTMKAAAGRVNQQGDGSAA